MRTKLKSTILTFVLFTLVASIGFMGCPIVDTFNGTVSITGGADTVVQSTAVATAFTATTANWDGATLTYTWSVLDATDADVTDAGSTTDQATFTPAAIDTVGTYTIKVVVSDGINTKTATKALQVTPTPFAGTVAISGGEAAIERLERMDTAFTATPAGFDAGATLTYAWTVAKGATDATNASNTLDQATYTPGPIDAAGTYTVTVVVSDGTNQATDTETFTVADITAEAVISTDATAANFGVYTETAAHKDQEWTNPVFIINESGSLGNENVAIADYEATASSPEGTKYLEASLAPNGIFYFGNGRPETAIVQNIGTWALHFKAKSDTAGTTLNALVEDGNWATPAAQDFTIGTDWDDYTLDGNTLTDVAIVIFTNKDTEARTISIDDVYIEYNIPPANENLFINRLETTNSMTQEADGVQLIVQDGGWGAGTIYSQPVTMDGFTITFNISNVNEYVDIPDTNPQQYSATGEDIYLAFSNSVQNIMTGADGFKLDFQYHDNGNGTKYTSFNGGHNGTGGSWVPMGFNNYPSIGAGGNGTDITMTMTKDDANSQWKLAVWTGLITASPEYVGIAYTELPSDHFTDGEGYVFLGMNANNTPTNIKIKSIGTTNFTDPSL